MALMSLKNNTSAIGIPGGTVCDGIDDITQASVEVSANTVVRAKNSQGEVTSVLVGKKITNLSASGYASNISGPPLGGAITVGGVTGKIISANIECSAEDFVKFSAEGRYID